MTMTPDACQFSMSMLLKQETALTQQLSDLLDREFAAITDKDFAAFEQTVAEKALAVEQLDLLEQERVALIEAAGQKPGPGDFLYFLQWCDPAQNITPAWEQLLSLAGKCRDQNLRNHHLIELCSRHTRETLRILRGEDPQPDLYQADGDTGSGHENHTLARA
ncbi:MAG: flagellar protein FlgN [Gammaproteobacteria bacterium]